MFFFLSKTLGFLIRPLIIIFGLLILSKFVRSERWKKIFFRTAIILIILLTNEFIFNEAMRAWEIAATPFSKLQKKYDYGVLLCGVAKLDVGPSDRVYTGSAADRVNHTLQLYKQGYISKILISGGTGRLLGSDQPEADLLSSLLQLMGVPETDILIENGSRNTHESAVESVKILEILTSPDKCLLITSASHMRRAAACFAKVGWPMKCFSADFRSHFRKYSFDVLLIPSVETLAGWHILFKEMTGYAAYWAAGYI